MGNAIRWRRGNTDGRRQQDDARTRNHEINPIHARQSTNPKCVPASRAKLEFLTQAPQPPMELPHAFSTPHHSAMNSAVAFVDFRSDSRSTYSLKPCIAAPLAPKHRLGML